METADKISTQFQQNGDYEYIPRLQALRTSLNKLIDEIVLAQDGETDLADKLAAIQTDVSTRDASIRSDFADEDTAIRDEVASAIADMVVHAGMTKDLSAAGFKITSLANAVALTDAVNLQTAQAILSAGAQPGDVPVTSLNKGTANNGQTLGIDDSGNIVGFDGNHVGDILYSIDPTKYPAPQYLPANGQAYDELTYTQLAAVLPKIFGAIADPAVMPASAVNFVCWSGDSVYMGVVYNQLARIYKRTGDTFADLGQLTADSASYPDGCSLSSTGIYFAVASPNDPRLRIFKNTADSYNELADPLDITLPSNAGRKTAFSPDDTYLAFASNNFYVFKRSGDDFQSISVPTIGGFINDFAWSSDGAYLAIAHAGSPGLTVLSRTGDTFTKVTDPAVVPSATVWRVAFSNDDSTIFWSANDPDEYLQSFNLNAGVLTNNPAPDQQPTTYLKGLVVGSDDSELFASDNQNPAVVSRYEFDGTNLVKAGVIETDESSTTNHMALSPNGDFLVFGDGTPSNLEIHKKQFLLPHINRPDVQGLSQAYIKTGE